MISGDLTWPHLAAVLAAAGAVLAAPATVIVALVSRRRAPPVDPRPPDAAPTVQVAELLDEISIIVERQRQNRAMTRSETEGLRSSVLELRMLLRERFDGVEGRLERIETLLSENGGA